MSHQSPPCVEWDPCLKKALVTELKEEFSKKGTLRVVLAVNLVARNLKPDAGRARLLATAREFLQVTL